MFEFRDPRYSFEANANTWHTLNQTAAFGADILTESKHMNRAWARSALFAGALWSNTMLRFYSHEIAHEYVYRHKNISIQNSLNLQSWTSSYIPGIAYPSWQRSQVDVDRLNGQELIAATAAGLNQDEFNAEISWRSSFQHGFTTFYDAQSYVLTKFRDVEYIIKSGSDEAPFAPGQRIQQLQYDVYAETPHLFDDVNLYRLALLNNGISISNQHLLNRALFADALSWHSWESLYALFSYLSSGKNKTRLFSFSIGENVEIMPPLFSHYMTPSGSFFNSSYVLNMNNIRLRLDIGSMIGFTNINAFQRYRFGLKALDVDLTSFWHIQPYFYINGQSGLNFSGQSIGIDNILHYSRTLALFFKAEYNYGDILENEIKREKTGFQTVLGFRVNL